ncbi:MAG: hypothetical protein K940chlam7_00573 [Chlamydiae bacterium]|nr:hypothetical protein [Chlamydiota bacterium]
MSATQKKKLCWNCEGRVSLEEENCPYCAVYVGPSPDENEKDILAPPYRIVDSEDEEVPSSPYAVDEEQEEEEVEVQLSETRSDLKKIVLPLCLLSAGSMLFLFGLILLLFSNHGVFTVSWNSEYWYLYLVFALPMAFFGWRVLRNLEEDEYTEPVPESHTHQS